MRAIATITIAAVVMVGFAIGSHQLINKKADTLIACVEKMESSIAEKQWDEARSGIEEFKQLWEKVSDPWSIMIHQEEVDDVDLSYKRLLKYIEAEDQVLSMGEVITLRIYIERITDEERINLPNIM